ncbi:MAG: acyltransferase [Roseiflexaceae bacterium]
MKGKNFRYIPAIDQLRGIAALIIICYHGLHLFSYQLRFQQPFSFDHWLESSHPLVAALIEGHTAVALFLVLSGFIFTYGAHEQTIDYASFLYNRVLRIFPLFVFLYMSAVFIFPERYSFLGFLQGLLLQANLPGATFIEPFTSLFWTIAVEFQFYLLFPLLLHFQRHYGVRYLLLVIALFLIVRALGTWLGGNPRDLSYSTILGRLDQFIIGMLIALLYRQRQLPRHYAFLSWLISVVALITSLAGFHAIGGYPAINWFKIFWPTLEAVLWGSFIYCYLCLWNHQRSWILLILGRIGNISYSLYLLHMIVLAVFIKANITILANTSHHLLNAIASTLVLVLPLSIGFAILTYHVIERPFLELRRTYLRKQPTIAQQNE